MHIDTTHNPVIQLVETTAIIIAAESSVVLTVGLRVTKLVETTVLINAVESSVILTVALRVITVVGVG